MKVLVAEDDPASRRVLEVALGRWGLDITVVEDGTEALSALQAEDGPPLAVLDWMMPGVDGVEVCRRLRASEENRPLYLILLTARVDREDVVVGLDAGADDYITKPFDNSELKARINVGRRVVELQQALRSRVDDLQNAMDHIQRLQGLIRICMHCHRILDDRETWQRLEEYLEEHSDATFSHGLCPDCLEEHYPRKKKKT